MWLRRVRQFLTRQGQAADIQLKDAPTFLIVGAQKCGTTSLYHYLAQHPAIFMARAYEESGEIHYFSGDTYPNDDWYRSLFRVPAEQARQIRATGESTPNYCYFPEAIERIHAFDKRIKLIMMLRNPIDRALSHYWMMRNKGQEDLSFDAALEQERERIQTSTLALNRFSYLTRGHYVEQLDRMCRYFPPNQILIRRTEDLAQQPQKILNDIADFIGVDTFVLHDFPHHRQGDYPPADAEVRQRLFVYFEPYNQQLTAQYGIKTDDWV